MIAQLKGDLEYLELSGSVPYLVLNTGSVGYKVFVTSDLASISKPGETMSLHTYMAVRENSQELFGFKKREELIFFELLISVSGIGPKSAMGILGVAPLTTLKEAIGTKDISYLTKVSGIGKKTAEKIILELKDKIDEAKSLETGDLKGDVDVLEALKALGYSHAEAREALMNIDEKVTGVNNRIKEALKNITN